MAAWICAGIKIFQANPKSLGVPLPRMSTRWDELHTKYSVEHTKLGKNVSSSEPNMNPVNLVGCPKLEVCVAVKQLTRWLASDEERTEGSR